ncbi:hypothetical protein VTH82DRAFT_5472 [Thermothelomyces myriococcoides]
MCGPETESKTPRIGARVDLCSPAGRSGLGNLLFLNPSSPSSTQATHVQFHQLKEELSPLGDWGVYDGVQVTIHVTGDLTKPLAESGVMRQFILRGRREGTGIPLGEAVSLQVGHDGIIGRRVSVRRGDELLADGIVGFNSYQ